MSDATGAQRGLETRLEDLEERYDELPVATPDHSNRTARLRLGVELIRDLDKWIREALSFNRTDLLPRGERLKIEVGKTCFDIDPISAEEPVMTEDDERQTRATQALIESLEEQLAAARDRLAEIAARPKDDFPPGTYLIVERNDAHKVAPRLYYKGDDGWMSTAGVVTWKTVRISFENEALTVYSVTNMEEVEV